MHCSRSCAFLVPVALVFALAFAGCDQTTPAPSGSDGTGDNQSAGCTIDADCGDGLTCVSGTCQATGGASDDASTDDVSSNGSASDGSSGPVRPGRLLVGHEAAAAYEAVPSGYIASAKSTFHVFYGHTSHGSQVVTGMNMLDTGSGSLDIEENGDVDLGYEGDLGWVDITRDVLNREGSDINVVMWSWCGGVSENTESGINIYLNAMNGLESDYPGVVFVYMTGHLDGTGVAGTLHVRNEQIRAYCNANNKVLYDFADIESYDPDGNYYPDGSDWCEWCETWCAAHTCPALDCVNDIDCAHTVCFNCYQKGRAFWWMIARIAGWNGDTADPAQ